jgi:hypothetical protein
LFPAKQVLLTVGVFAQRGSDSLDAREGASEYHHVFDYKQNAIIACFKLPIHRRARSGVILFLCFLSSVGQHYKTLEGAFRHWTF